MPYPDMTQYVTRDELKGRLEPLGEIRDMLRDDIRGLHDGQERLGEKIDGMNTAICNRMDEANGRTSKLEKKLDKTELEALEGVAVSKEILEKGCHQIRDHAAAVDTLESAGVILSPREIARVEFKDERSLRTLVQQHPKKSLAVGSGMLVGVAALVPHCIDFVHWVAHLFSAAK